MSFPCEEILQCIQREGYQIGQIEGSSDNNIGSYFDDTIKLTIAGGVSATPAGPAAVPLGMLLGLGTGAIFDSWELGYPQISQIWERPYAAWKEPQLQAERDAALQKQLAFLRAGDHELESFGIMRPYLPNDLRADVYAQAYVNTDFDYLSGYNREELANNLQIFSILGGMGTEEALRLGTMLANSPFLYPTLLESEQAVGEGSLNDIVANNPALIETLANSFITTEVLATIIESSDVAGLLANQLFATTGNEEECNPIFDQAVQAAVNRAMGMGEGAEGEGNNPLAQLHADMETLKEKLSDLATIEELNRQIEALRSIIPTAREVAALVPVPECSCRKDEPLRTDKDREWALAQMPPPLSKNGRPR